MSKASFPSIFTVSQLNQRARQLLEISFSSVQVEGEISNLARPASGHWYFTLKDANAQVRCAMFRSRTAALKFQPKEGDQVELRAKVSLYEGRGDYQLIVDSMKPAGEGALLLAFQQLKERLAQEGLFAPEHKKPLPKIIRRVAVVTSATGAAIHDILTVLKRRDPRIEVDIYPTAVQGKEASAQIVAAIERANRDQQVDVLIVGRGGGSLEDLWCFNEEQVARAIFASALPVVSAVGHEVDFSIADFVADLRAATPSAAAELVSSDQTEKLTYLAMQQQRLQKGLTQYFARLQHQLSHLQQRLRSPERRLQQHYQQLDQLENRLQRAFAQQQQRHLLQLKQLAQALQQQHPKRQLHTHSQQLQQLHQRLVRSQQQHLQTSQLKFARFVQLLQSLSPLQVLARGYSLTRNQQAQVVHSTKQLKLGDSVITQLQEGEFEAQVTKLTPASLANAELQGKLL